MAGVDPGNQFPNSKMASAVRAGQSQFRSVESAPATNSAAVVPSDATVYNPPIRTLYVGGAGNVTIVTPQGASVLYTAPPVGTTLNVDAAKVMLTGTTATLLVGAQ